MSRADFIVRASGVLLVLAAALAGSVTVWGLSEQGWLWPPRKCISDLGSPHRSTAEAVNLLVFKLPGLMLAAASPGVARWLQGSRRWRTRAATLLAASGALLCAVGEWPFPSPAHWPIVAALAVTSASTMAACGFALRGLPDFQALPPLLLLTGAGLLGNMFLLQLPFPAAYQRGTMTLGLACLILIGIRMTRGVMACQDA